MQIILRQRWTERKRVSSRCAKRQRITRTGGALTVCIHTESLLGNGNCNLSLELVSSPTLYPMLYRVISHILHHPLHHSAYVYVLSQPANILLDEHGHVRISDLGLACDFSKKKPHASV